MNTPPRSQSSKQDVFDKDTNPLARSRSDDWRQCFEIHRFPSGVNWHSDCETTCSANAREGTMFKRIGLVVAGLALSASVAGAGSVDRKNLQVFNDVAKSVNRYVHFTIFDDVSANVEDGVVTLTGRVTMPYKRDDIEKRVAEVDGVREVRDQDQGVAGVAIRRSSCDIRSRGRFTATRTSGTTPSAESVRSTSSSSTDTSR